MMKFLYAKILVLVVLALCLMGVGGGAHAAESAPVKSGRVTAQLVTSHDVATPGQELMIALSLRLEPKWHTYWRNAGGPGHPATIDWQVPAGVTIGDMVWPLPIIVHTGPIINYAFEDRLLLPMPLSIPQSAKPGDEITIDANAGYLVCHIVCLPEQAQLQLVLPIAKEASADNRWHGNIKRGLDKSPKASSVAARAQMNGDKLELFVEFPGAGQFPVEEQYKNPYFFPYEQDLINADDPQSVRVGPKGITLSMTPGFLLKDGLKNPVVGVLAFDKAGGDKPDGDKPDGDKPDGDKPDGDKPDGDKPDGNSSGGRTGIEITADILQPLDSGPLASAQNAASAPNTASEPKARLEHKTRSGQGGIGLGLAVLGAFIGGLILNFMPCVFPVLSMKVLGFTRSAHLNQSTIRREAWAYALGVIVSFMSLAGVLIVLKTMGASLGWGFQLQNPVIIGALAALFILIAFNLFGGFEVGARVQNIGSKLTASQSLYASFFTGVLAVVVASPCTAPFMAGAIGFAFTQPAIITLLIFLALGIGFATPFVLLAYSPKLLARLPKPGPWMESFKQFMAFPMLLTAIWLYWVLAGLSGPDGIAAALLAALLLIFALWASKYGRLGKVFTVMSLIGAVLLLAGLRGAPDDERAQGHAVSANAWSLDAVARAQGEGRPVFVDFTADWCVTCKVNEKLVLNRKSVQDLFAQYNTQVLIADWTRQDEDIAAELARHGRAGVPLYLVYSPTSDTPQILPQTLSVNVLKSALEQAGTLSP